MGYPRRLDTDRLSMVPREEAIRLAYEALFPVQNEDPPEPMVAAIAVLFAVVCQKLGLAPEQIPHMGVRMLRDQANHDKCNKARQSLADFATIRIAGKETTIS